MRRVLLTLKLLFVCIISKAVGEDSSNFSPLREIDSFINTIKESAPNTKGYKIYIAKFKNNREKSCLSLGVMLNDYDLKYINDPDYYFFRETDIVVTFGQYEDLKADLKGVELHRYNDKARLMVTNRLYPSQLGGFTGTSPAYLVCWGDVIERSFYGNYDELPEEFSIWDYEITGGEIKIFTIPKNNCQDSTKLK